MARLRTGPAPRDGGFAMVGMVLVGLGIVLLAGIVVIRSSGMFNATFTDRGWEQSVFVAESGVDTALTQLSQDPTYWTVSSTTNLSTRVAIVAAAETLAVQPANRFVTPEGEFVIVKQPGALKVYGVGASPSWDDPRREVRVIEATFASRTCLPDAALVANGLIEVSSGSRVMTLPSTQHEANAYGNGGFKGTSDMYVDGDIRVVGTISNVPTGSVYGEAESGAAPIGFPSDTELAAWQTELISAAQAGGTISGMTVSTTMTITAPRYINGNLMLASGGRLTIQGPGVVYVSGKVELGGDSQMWNSALLATGLNFKQGGGTSYFMTGSVADAGLVSFLANNTAAVEFQGDATGPQGVVYAARGGVKLSGAAALHGAAIAGGPGSYGLIKGTATVSYPTGLLAASAWLPAFTVEYGACGSIGESTFYFGNGAIVANGNVTLSGGAYTLSNPETANVASVLTNGSYADSTSKVDGDIAAGTTVNVNPANVTGSITAGLGSHIAFPTNSEIGAFRDELAMAAQAGGTYPAGSYGTNVTITTPKYVPGNFEVSGGNTLTLTGGGVFFVAGTLTISGGGTMINDGIIGADGVITVSGGGGYNNFGAPEATGVFGFAVSDKAIVLSGGSGAPEHGVAYAPKGGIVLSGGSNWNGALIAGGTGGLGKITLSGGSQLKYRADLVTGHLVLPDPDPDAIGTSHLIVLVSRREI